METLSIKSKKAFSLSNIERILSQRWRVESSPGETVAVHGEKSRAYLHPDVEFAEHGMHCLLVDYSDIELAKSLLEMIADDPALTVDNDFGTVLPGNEFVARCKTVKGWDWRH